ncbi:hypothetical protein JW930_04480 [Candidatus Woesearchaeota archaeon]|nr:hypothetical protein [Candidatus Woesearchaeota archaeon]
MIHDYGLSLATVAYLIGVDSERVKTDPLVTTLDPDIMAAHAVFTFRDLPEGYSNRLVLGLRSGLHDALAALGCRIEPWLNTWESGQEPVPPGIHAVVDVPRDDGTRRAHAIYRLEDKQNTQVITVAEVPRIIRDPTHSYLNRTRAGIETLLNHRSVIVIGTYSDKPNLAQILNMNLDVTPVDLGREDALLDWVRNMLVPKASPIIPADIKRFQKGYFNPEDSRYRTYVEALIKLSRGLSSTGLFPPGQTLVNLVEDRLDRRILDGIVGGRSGYSFGFLAVGWAEYRSQKIINEEVWESLVPAEGLENIRCDGDIWYIRLDREGRTRYYEVPVVHIASSLSGRDKSALTRRDVGIISVKNGELHFKVAEGVDWEMEKPRASFDLMAQVAMIYGSAFGRDPSRIDEPIEKVQIHYHGYPHPDWLVQGTDYVAGINNIGAPCGTPQAGLLNFFESLSLYDANPDLRVAHLIEPGHGTNILVDLHDLDYIIERLQAGRRGRWPVVELGSRHWNLLREKSQSYS